MNDKENNRMQKSRKKEKMQMKIEKLFQSSFNRKQTTKKNTEKKGNTNPIDDALLPIPFARFEHFIWLTFSFFVCLLFDLTINIDWLLLCFPSSLPQLVIHR
jgi:hypothetical protein